MVETKNNYKHKRYNNNRRGNFRSFKNNNSEQKGLLNFLFSVNGKISKNLFAGFALVMDVLIVAFGILTTLINPENNVLNIFITLINLVLIWILIASGYKRAHALGISGFYSILGSTVCKPYFLFYKTDRDFANDGAYKNKFNVFKKIGNFANKNVFTRIAYILIIALLGFIPCLVSKDAMSESTFHDVRIFIILIALFNIVQLFAVKLRLFRRYYTPFTKVISFVSYTLTVVAISFFISSVYILIMIAAQIGV